MHLSGLVLDVYDDQSGEVLKSIYPTREDIPVMVKTAHVLLSEEREHLPDDVFALVMVNDEGATLRKYACVDPGNTVLAVEYFLSEGSKLPREAQKLAAANLLHACAWYDLTPPEELTKVAVGGMLLLGANLASAAPAVAQAKQGRMAARQSGSVINPALMRKHGEVSGTVLMPGQEDTDETSGFKSSKTVVKKTASTGHLVQGKEKHPQSEKPAELEQNAWRKDKNPSLRQHHQLTPHINVQGSEPPSPTKMKVSQITALPGRYPLDSYEQVKVASAYFDEYWMQFSPEDRREYCANMVKRANALCIPVSDLAQKYGSATYATAEEVAFALDARRALLEPQAVELLDKVAAVLPKVSPEIFALTLAEFDKTAGLHYHYDRDVPDPFLSTFGFEKQAEYSEVIGNDYINESRLRELGISGHAFLCKRFGKEMAEEFQKDPVGIFKSLPLEQKKIIMRVASDDQPTNSQS